MHGGFHYKSNKFLTFDEPIEELSGFKIHKFNLYGHIGNPSVPVVKVGDSVKMGQLIGAEENNSGINIFSSVSGKVIDINSIYITIENDFLDDYVPLKKLENPTKNEILARIKEAGIIGMGGAGFPTFIKYQTDKKIDILILNGAECEDYITTDDLVMSTYSTQVLQGAILLAKIHDIKNILVGIEKDKTQAIKYMKESAEVLSSKQDADINPNIKIVPIKAKYPHGAEKMLIKTLTGKEVKENALPADIGIIVNNVHTAYSVFRAVTLGEPCIKRVITVSGRAVVNKGNYLVRTGSSVGDIFHSAGGVVYEPKKLEDYKKFAKDRLKACEELAEKMHIAEEKQEKKQCEIKLKQEIKDTNKEIYKRYKIAMEGARNNLVKILAGGPFMGVQIDEEYCIELRTSAILFLAENEIIDYMPSACINCKKCARVCPVSILPMQINDYADIKNYEECKKLNVESCIECGACSYVCPAKIPLAYNMKAAKKVVKNLFKKNKK